MKKIFFTLAILFTINAAFSQSDLGINLCGNTQNVIKKNNVIIISKEDFFNCSEVTANNENLTIVSFSLGISAGDNYIEISVIGNEISEKVIATIKKYNPSKLYIEKIKLSSKKGVIQSVGAFTIILKTK